MAPAGDVDLLCHHRTGHVAGRVDPATSRRIDTRDLWTALRVISAGLLMVAVVPGDFETLLITVPILIGAVIYVAAVLLPAHHSQRRFCIVTGIEPTLAQQVSSSTA